MKLNGGKNQCPTCDKYFYSNFAFERHRTGKYGVDRRCRTEEEMKEKGMFADSNGYWKSYVSKRVFKL